MRLLLMVLIPGLAGAELLRIEMGFGGMECASCTEFIESRMSRNRNVQSVRVDKEKGILRLELKPENKMRLEQVRDLVQQSGFTPKAATVEARGIVQPDGFLIPETGQEFKARDPHHLLKALTGKRARLEADVETQPGRSSLLIIKKAAAAE
ncbi:MAG: heavy-metal-associated domain-containing protein [Bryobacteraceae bacterium]|nr:heavy-metal-associated domain-containing protein [Bryobacteraceae bacterium]